MSKIGGRADIGWAWLDRLSDRWADGHTRRAFGAELQGRPDGAVGAVVLVVSCCLLYAFVAGLLVAAVWLCTLSVPAAFLGVVLAGVAVELRPRAGRLPKSVTEVTAAQAPQLHELVGRVAAAVGSPVPAVYVVDDEFNAYVLAYGLLRRKAMVLGLPLWHALSAQQRVALLGHELGHFVNGDLRRSLLVQPAFTTLDRLSRLLLPAGRRNVLEGLISGVLRAVLLPARLALQILAFRDGQRAEYRADRMAVAAAGRAATLDLLDLLTVRDSAYLLLRRGARAGREPSQWPVAMAAMLAGIRSEIELRRDASVHHELSLFASHPPAGLRARLVEARPEVSVEATVVFDDAANALVDAELAAWSARSARSLRLV